MKRVTLLSILGSLLICLSFIPKAKKIVVIDVSHGGMDRGSIHDNILEKDIVLSIANKVQELNRNGKIEIILTRQTDLFISLTDRVKFINSQTPSFLLSLHANFSGKRDVNGFELFVKENFMTEESLQMATLLENQYPKEIRKRNISAGNFHLLKNSNRPSALLELGFLSNANDRNYLLSDKGQWEIAEAIYNTIR